MQQRNARAALERTCLIIDAIRAAFWAVASFRNNIPKHCRSRIKKRYGEVDGRVAGIYNSPLRLNILFIKEIKLFHSAWSNAFLSFSCLSSNRCYAAFDRKFQRSGPRINARRVGPALSQRKGFLEKGSPVFQKALACVLTIERADTPALNLNSPLTLTARFTLQRSSYWPVLSFR